MSGAYYALIVWPSEQDDGGYGSGTSSDASGESTPGDYDA